MGDIGVSSKRVHLSLSLSMELGCWVRTAKLRSVCMHGWKEASIEDFPANSHVLLTKRRDRSRKLSKSRIKDHTQSTQDRRKKLHLDQIWNPKQTVRNGMNGYQESVRANEKGLRG